MQWSVLGVEYSLQKSHSRPSHSAREVRLSFSWVSAHSSPLTVVGRSPVHWGEQQSQWVSPLSLQYWVTLPLPHPLLHSHCRGGCRSTVLDAGIVLGKCSGQFQVFAGSLRKSRIQVTLTLCWVKLSFSWGCSSVTDGSRTQSGTPGQSAQAPSLQLEVPLPRYQHSLSLPEIGRAHV